MKKLNPETRKELGGSFIQLTDGVTHYSLSGPADGPSVVLVHGNAVPMPSWDNNVKALESAGFHVLRYDIFGHGFSDRPEFKTYNKDLYTRQIKELTEKLEIKTPFCMAGTSQGGSISAGFAAEYPGKVSKLALLGPLFDDFSGKKALKLIKSPIGSLLIYMGSPKKTTDPSRVLYSDKLKPELQEKILKQFEFKGKKRAVLANLRGDFTTIMDGYKKLAETPIPILLTWGESDRTIPEDSMQRLRELIPRIEYHRIPLASHLAHYEFAEEINPLLVEFFSK